MLGYRLLFGTLMTVFFTGLVVLDGWLDGSITACQADIKPLQGTLLCVLISVLIIPANFELSRLFAAKNLKLFVPVSIIASILLAACWYLSGLVGIPPAVYLPLVCVFTFMALLLYQYVSFGLSGVVANCGANCFSILYLGLFGAFVLAVRIDFGLWPLLMFVFVVKSADIGAYAIGTPFGKHKFSPKISPGKTWEGMAGAIVVAVIVAIFFAAAFDIMIWPLAAIFGFCFAFIGQIGDLVESMIKRDAKQKDSSDIVPGFGGILDIVDSPLIAAPFAYLFFMFCS
jgi:phosphatidate cytidylyltransferase